MAFCKWFMLLIHHQLTSGTSSHQSLQRQMRIASDIEVAKNNAQILSQTLSFTDPEKEDISKNELIQVRGLLFTG